MRVLSTHASARAPHDLAGQGAHKPLDGRDGARRLGRRRPAVARVGARPQPLEHGRVRAHHRGGAGVGLLLCAVCQVTAAGVGAHRLV